MTSSSYSDTDFLSDSTWWSSSEEEEEKEKKEEKKSVPCAKKKPKIVIDKRPPEKDLTMVDMINKTSLDKRRIRLHVIPCGLTKSEWELLCKLWRDGKLQKKEILFAANLDDKTFNKFPKADKKKLLFMLHPDKNSDELKPLCNVLFSKVKKMCNGSGGGGNSDGGGGGI